MGNSHDKRFSAPLAVRRVSRSLAWIKHTVEGRNIRIKCSYKSFAATSIIFKVLNWGGRHCNASLTDGKMEAQRSSMAPCRPMEGSSVSLREHPGVQKKKRHPERDGKNPPLTSEKIYFTTTAARNKLYNVSLELKLLSHGKHTKFLTRNSNNCYLLGCTIFIKWANKLNYENQKVSDWANFFCRKEILKTNTEIIAMM